MNILVTGANGQLGTALRRASASPSLASRDRYIFTDADTLDITDPAAVGTAVKAHAAGVIVNCAAYTDVEGAEEHPRAAHLLNATAAGHLAVAARDNGAVLIHISTDYVFGGHMCNTPLTEEAPVSPTGVYGATKLEGERLIEASGAKAMVIRTAWLYSETGRNFLKTMLSLTASRPGLKVVYDQVGTPTYAGDLACAIAAIIDRRLFTGREGTYHYSGEGVCSWYDFAVAIAARAGHTACTVAPCLSSQFPSKVKRPAYSVLDKTRFKETFGLEIPHWALSLDTCINRLTHSDT